MMATMTSLADTELAATEQRDDQEHRRNPRRRRGSRTRRKEAPPDGRTGARFDRTLTLKVAAREWVWLYDHRHGMSLEEIAGYEGLSIERVLFGVMRSEALESQRTKDDLIGNLKSGRLDGVEVRLIPLFPIGAFTPQSTCPHHDSIERGSRLCCMVCHASGMDDHPGIRHDPKTDPSPEPVPAPTTDALPGRSRKPKETRKQRRRRQFTEVPVA
jgi:hypothetical protein